ncbi:DUF222 domain-containing protein [Gordonia iterans]
MNSDTTTWPAMDLSAAGIGRIPEGLAEPDQMNAFLLQVCDARAGESYLMWRRYLAIAEMVDLAVAWAADADADHEDHRVLEPRTMVAARVQVGLSVGSGAAQAMVDRAEAARDRIPHCGNLLRDGVVSVQTFSLLVFETAAVTDRDLLALIDVTVAQALRELGAVSSSRAQKTARSVVRRIDPEGARRDREQARAAERVQSFAVGGDMATIAITGSCEDVAQAEAGVEATAAGVCENDPRSVAARRSAAALARLKGVAFTCACGADDCAARLSQEEIDARCARLVVHVVCPGSTLEGGDEPGVLDGYGAIDAGLVRDIVAREDVAVRTLDLAELSKATARAADRYRPTAACEVAVRTLFGQCTWPGCSRQAWRCDLDHVCEYNHADPAAGGATCFCNLNPKCEFHHLIKTFGEGWLDDQVIDAHGVIWTEVSTPEGFTVRSQALNTWLLPDLGLVPCSHGEIWTPLDRPDGLAGRGEAEPMRKSTRLEAKHAYRMRLRAEHRRAAESGSVKIIPPSFDDDTPPPF